MPGSEGHNTPWETMTVDRFLQLYITGAGGDSLLAPSELAASAAVQALLAYPAHLLERELAGRAYRRTRTALTMQLERLRRELECRYGDPATLRALHGSTPEPVKLRHIDVRTMHYVDPETNELLEPVRPCGNSDGPHVRRFVCRPKPPIDWRSGRGIRRFG
jgi:hypothetical protein